MRDLKKWTKKPLSSSWQRSCDGRRYAIAPLRGVRGGSAYVLLVADEAGRRSWVGPDGEEYSEAVGQAIFRSAQAAANAAQGALQAAQEAQKSAEADFDRALCGATKTPTAKVADYCARFAAPVAAVPPGGAELEAKVP